MISIIVPVYNEENTLDNFISTLSKATSGKDAELIFVDGGSTDRTFEICNKSSFNVFRSPKKGRAAQMNFGAQKSKGDILYFLHADSIPPLSFIVDINDNIKKGYQSGCYRLSFKPDHYLLKFYAWFTKFDIDLFRFGDQSFFVKKEIFKDVGGFDETLSVMEDQQMVRDIKKQSTFVIMKNSVTTSSRKYIKVGVFKLQLIFALIVVLYYLGINQQTIVDFYSKQLN
tara:strand:+ start:1576 stop:2259 length:684 start_codon:yes stop_codon:yes gene_type:complete